MKVLISLSGGLDSATLLGLLKQEGYEVEAVSFTYGSKHNKYENDAAFAISRHYDIPWELIDLTEAMKGFKSNLLLSGDEIPEGHYHGENMRKTVVPARNMIFISLLVGLAISREIPYIALGVHAGDHFIYPDCRPDFITSITEAAFMATDGALKEIKTPFINDPKEAIVSLGDLLKIPFEITRTCYKDQPIACGVCGSCTERLDAFKKCGLTDPIKYE